MDGVSTTLQEGVDSKEKLVPRTMSVLDYRPGSQRLDSLSDDDESVWLGMSHPVFDDCPDDEVMIDEDIPDEIDGEEFCENCSYLEGLLSAIKQVLKKKHSCTWKLKTIKSFL